VFHAVGGGGAEGRVALKIIDLKEKSSTVKLVWQ
jgi:hypothetical protein